MEWATVGILPSALLTLAGVFFVTSAFVTLVSGTDKWRIPGAFAAVFFVAFFASIVNIAHSKDMVSERNSELLVDGLTAQYGEVTLIPNTFPGANVKTGFDYTIRHNGNAFNCQVAVGATTEDVAAMCETGDAVVELSELAPQVK